MINAVVRRAARTLGYEILPRWRLDARAAGEATRRIFVAYGIETVLDIGANRGGYRDFLRHYVEFDGAIHSFEPAPELAEMLSDRAKSDPNWTIHPFALGATESQLELNRFSDDVLNSLKAPTDLIYSHLRTKEAGRVTVDVKRLDDVAPALPDLCRCFVKMDVQGFEREVIAGGAQVFGTCPAAQAEVGTVPIYQDTLDLPEAIAVFKSHGLDLAEILTIARMPDLRAREFDCMFVRPSMLSAGIGRGGVASGRKG